MRTTTRNTVIGLVAGAVAASGFAGAAQAATDTTREEHLDGLFYANTITGNDGPPYLMFAGGTAEDFCAAGGDTGWADAVFPVSALVQRSTEPRTGQAQLTERFTERVEMSIYDDEGIGAPEFLDAYCPIYHAGGEMPQPLAVGMGTVRSYAQQTENAAGGPPHVVVRNTSQGTLRTADGTRLVVRGTAHVTVSPTLIFHELGVEVLSD